MNIERVRIWGPWLQGEGLVVQVCEKWSSSTSLPSLSLNGFRSNWVVHMNVDKK